MPLKDFEILTEIGRGSMGVVFLAKDRRLERYVALKQISFSSNGDEQLEEMVELRFQQEARTMGGLNHPNIVTIYEFIQDENNHDFYLVMELLEGDSLEKILAERLFISVELALKIVIQACEALSYIHRQGIIHRDIKPGNLFFSNQGLLKLMDFGLASTRKKLEVTSPGMIMGSVNYMPVEQIENPLAVDSRVDVYALGVTLYRALSGEYPFGGENIWEIITQIKKAKPRAISRINPKISEELGKIIMKAIERDPEKRYQKIEDFQQELLLYNREKIGADILPYFYSKQAFLVKNEQIKEKEKTLIIRNQESFKSNQEIEKTVLLDFSSGKSEIELLPENNQYLAGLELTEQNLEEVAEAIKQKLEENLDELKELEKQQKILFKNKIKPEEEKQIEEFQRKIEFKENKQEKLGNLNLLISQKINICQKILKSVKLRAETAKIINPELLRENWGELEKKQSIFTLELANVKKIGKYWKESFLLLAKIDLFLEKNKASLAETELISKEIKNVSPEPAAIAKKTNFTTNSWEAEIKEELLKTDLLEFDLSEPLTIFTFTSFFLDKKLVAKAFPGDLIEFKSPYFSGELGDFISEEAIPVFKSRERYFRVSLIEKEISLNQEIINRMEKIKENIFREISLVLENILSMYKEIGKVAEEKNSKSRQQALAKNLELKKAVIELKSLVEEINSEKKAYILNITEKLMPHFGKFPLLLMNFSKNKN